MNLYDEKKGFHRMENHSNFLTEQFKIIDQMAADWPSPIVARKKVEEFSGGAISGKTLANLDSQGKGPDGSFILCNQTVYPVSSLVKFMKDRAAVKWSRKTPRQCKKV